ncbi:site-2 protease family protein [Streptomyces roseolilacinus]|uniref:Site-2 protease family protein n=1 Tax=Streptomyces roseolilacinus TaxID=66904 RepID=A0A918B1U5_9ACTN|nr:site-2 protease family protein [Streptomyces roseolilacinus]GGQ16385.1 site-2 protease family protein [Streptomyces roseolilacinus]
MAVAVSRRISPVFLGIAAATAAAGWAVWSRAGGGIGLAVAVFLFVTGAWVVSLCLHEYAHARTALHCGDRSVAAKGYLTLNPLRYTHAVLSVLLPVLFLVTGGIGLPGGAVFVERHRIRGRWRHSLVSAAGPLTNALFALVCTAPFWLGALDGVPPGFRFALAFTALLQVTAAALNALPVPGLDGYGVVEPWLSERARRRVEPFAPYGLLAVFVLLLAPEVNGVFFGLVDGVLGALGVTGAESSCGRDLYRFWRETDPACAFLSGVTG